MNAIAVQTLGKDMTFRDYAQGAYRMRGIGVGQTIRMLVIPEVKGLIQETKKLCGQLHVQAAGAAAAAAAMTGDASTFVADAAAWLYANGMQSEQMQSIVLSKQNIKTLARKTALENVTRAVASSRRDRYVRDQLARTSVAYFEEQVKLSPAETIEPQQSFSEQLVAIVDQARRFELIDAGAGWTAAQEILRQLQGGQEHADGLDGMMEQEQEQEEQQQKEQEQELEVITLPQQSDGRREPLRWEVSLLRQHTAEPEGLGFVYPLSDFETRRKFSEEEKRAMRARALEEFGVVMTDAEIDLTLARQAGGVKLGFPRTALITKNFSDATETEAETAGLSQRRLRHASVLLQWLPSPGPAGDLQAADGTGGNAIALTLSEAETIRCAIQQRHGLLADANLQVALVSSGTVIATTEVASASASVAAASHAQHLAELEPEPEPAPEPHTEPETETASVQPASATTPIGLCCEKERICLLFFNGTRAGITRAAGKILMECLQRSSRHERLSWFESVGDMRRSEDTTSWRSVPSLLSLFSLNNIEQLDSLLQLRKEVSESMDRQGLTVVDVDANNDGCIQVDELVQFISRLLSVSDGRHGSHSQNSHGQRHLEISALVRDADVSNDGVLQYDEFTACTHTTLRKPHASLAFIPSSCSSVLCCSCAVSTRRHRHPIWSISLLVVLTYVRFGGGLSEQISMLLIESVLSQTTTGTRQLQLQQEQQQEREEEEEQSLEAPSVTTRTSR